MRHGKQSPAVAEAAVRHRNVGVVGFDIAGPEANFPPSKHLRAFDYLASHFIPATVHAGEGEGLESIASALVDGRALRLGHGVRIAEDLIFRQDAEGGHIELGEMATWVRDRRIALEISASSNVQTGAISQWGHSLADHPFDLLYRMGLHVTVNADNRLMSNTSLTKELVLLAEAFNYGLDDIKTFQLNAAEAAFLPLPAREEIKATIHEGFTAAQVFA
jgi:adenosine deaminase